MNSNLYLGLLNITSLQSEFYPNLDEEIEDTFDKSFEASLDKFFELTFYNYMNWINKIKKDGMNVLKECDAAAAGLNTRVLENRVEGPDAAELQTTTTASADMNTSGEGVSSELDAATTGDEAK